jgi:predicted PolB exonuclease-like 3'-5' exonuclease
VPIQYGDSEHQFWNGYFKRYFGKEYVHFDFTIRVLSSFMLAA